MTVKLKESSNELERQLVQESVCIQLKKELGTKLAAFKELLSQHTCAE